MMIWQNLLNAGAKNQLKINSISTLLTKGQVTMLCKVQY